MGYDDQKRALRTDLQTLTNKGKTLYADMEAKGADKVTPEERAAFEQVVAEGKTKRQQLDALIALDENDSFVNAPAGQAKAQERHGQPRGRKTWGQIVTESKQFKEARQGDSERTPRMANVNVKAISSDSASAGALVVPMRDPEVVSLPQRPRSILELITNSTTTSNLVEYSALVERTNSAAPVVEYANGLFGLKPGSNLAWELRESPVKTIATWIETSRNILQDAPRLQTEIDNELTEMVRVCVENEVIAGSGTGQHLLGILNTPGILTRTQGSGSRAKSTDTVADTIRRGITDVVLQFYTPNAVLLNPTDTEEIELQKDTTGQYITTMDPATGTIWRLAATDTAAVSANTGIVGDFMMAATIWDRMLTEIRVGEPNDDFFRNVVAILAEVRVAFAVKRANALCKLIFNDPA